MNYWETPLYALRMAEGRLRMLLDADMPGSDHPSATEYVLKAVGSAAQGIEAGTDETLKAAQPEGREPVPKDAPNPNRGGPDGS